MVLPLFSACRLREDDKEDAEHEAYYATQTLDWNKNGKYSGTLSLSPEIDDEFIDFSTNDFEMIAYKTVDSEEISVSINDFSVEKDNETKLSYSFSTPMIGDNEFGYLITSTKGVTKNDCFVSMELTVKNKAIALSTAYTGAYTGSDAIKIDAKINTSDSGVNAKFNNTITPDMFRLPNGIDGTVTVTKTSETEIKFEITNLAENLAIDKLVVEIDERAFDYSFSESVYLTINYVNPKIDVDQSSIVIDRQNNKLTIGKMYLPDGAKGSENGILVNETYAEIIS